MKKNNKKGFTLAELLIVVAIIAVLTAIAIPVFTSQLEKSREATDQANLRSAYAEQMTLLLTWDGTSTIKATTVNAKQTQPNWQSNNNEATIKIADGLKSSSGTDSGFSATAVTSPGTWTVQADGKTGKVNVSAG